MIELLKIHLHTLARRNQAEHTELDLNWVLDELGVSELK